MTSKEIIEKLKVIGFDKFLLDNNLLLNSDFYEKEFGSYEIVFNEEYQTFIWRTVFLFKAHNIYIAFDINYNPYRGITYNKQDIFTPFEVIPKQIMVTEFWTKESKFEDV